MGSSSSTISNRENDAVLRQVCHRSKMTPATGWCAFRLFWNGIFHQEPVWAGSEKVSRIESNSNVITTHCWKHEMSILPDMVIFSCWWPFGPTRGVSSLKSAPVERYSLNLVILYQFDYLQQFWSWCETDPFRYIRVSTNPVLTIRWENGLVTQLQNRCSCRCWTKIIRSDIDLSIETGYRFLALRVGPHGPIKVKY